MKFKIYGIILLLVLFTSASASVLGQASESPIILKGGHTGNTESSSHIACLRWAQLVKERTNGMVLIEVYPAEQLGSERELMERANLGAIDWTVIGAGGATQFVSEFAIFENAYTFKSIKHCINVFSNREFRDELANMLEKNSNLTILGLAYNGTRSVLSKIPFRTPEEAQGLRLRIPDVESFRIVAEAIGATPTPLPFGEVYMALKQGVIDAAEAYPEALVLMKFPEIAKNLIMTEHMIQGVAFFFNKKVFYDRLSNEQQEILIDALYEVMKDRSDTLIKDQDDYINQMKEEYGVNVIELTSQEREVFQKRAFEALQKEYIPKWNTFVEKWGMTMWEKFLSLAE